MTQPAPVVVLTDLIDEHYQLVYRYAYRLSGHAADAEDVTQQTFLAAQACLGQLREAACARGWLLTIARNQFLRTCRTMEPTLTLPDVDFAQGCPPEPVDPLDPEDLQAAISELPEEFRTPIVLFYFGKLRYKDIATQLGVPLGTVMSRLSRAKTALRQRLSLETSDVDGRERLRAALAEKPR